MPEINRVPFRYEPIGGDLYLDSFRMNFYTERLDDIKDELQRLTAKENKIAREIEGELVFTDDEDVSPEIRDVRYSHRNDREKHGEPFPKSVYVLD